MCVRFQSLEAMLKSAIAYFGSALLRRTTFGSSFPACGAIINGADTLINEDPIGPLAPF
jgi:hypothetical protein